MTPDANALAMAWADTDQERRLLAADFERFAKAFAVAELKRIKTEPFVGGSHVRRGALHIRNQVQARLTELEESL